MNATGDGSPSLQLLKQRISEGRLLGPDAFDTDLDEVLDERDCQAFDSEWVRVCNALDAHATGTDEQLVTRLREAAFKKTYAMTENSDLAAYVSDDFGLIGMALLTSFADPWLNALWIEYREQRLPYGELKPVTGELPDMIQ